MPTILVQKGHHAPREPGFEGGTGATGEQLVVGVIGEALAKLLGRDNRFAVRVIPGKIPPDVRSGAFAVDAFVSLHCDGSADKNRRGWGVGYPAGAVNKRLASLIADEIAKGHPSGRLADNYTVNMSGYYGYSRVPTTGPEVLVEHGFSSSPAEKQWMLDNAGRIAEAHYRALLALFELPAKPPPPSASWVTPEQARAAWQPGEPVWAMTPGPARKPAWTWQRDAEIARRRAILAGLDT